MMMMIMMMMMMIIIRFHLSFVMLTVISSRYSVRQLSRKVDNSTFLTQICPENGFRFEISEN